MITFGNVVVGVIYVGGFHLSLLNENGDAFAKTSEIAVTATARVISNAATEKAGLAIKTIHGKPGARFNCDTGAYVNGGGVRIYLENS